MDTATLIKSLQSTLCPGCGGHKESAQTFCRRCYFMLDGSLRSHLYDRVGQGYEEAVGAALKSLKVEQPHWPKEAPDARA